MADLTHDTFVRVLASRDVFGIREPRAYLSTIANGLVTDLFRRRELSVHTKVLASLPEPRCLRPKPRALSRTLVAIMPCSTA